MPKDSSTPEDTSTKSAFVIEIASFTFSILSPPDKIQGLIIFNFCTKCQSKATPLPPGLLAELMGGVSNNI